MLGVGLFFSTVVNAGPEPFAHLFGEDRDVYDYRCDEEESILSMRTKQIAEIYLSIQDFIYKSGDTEKLDIELSSLEPPTQGGQELYQSFVKSVEKYNPDKEVALYIEENAKEFKDDCTDKIE